MTKIKTESGCIISVTREEESFEDNKILSFGQMVRSVELTKGEAVKLGTLLQRNIKQQLVQYIREMIMHGFFREGRSTPKDDPVEESKRNYHISILGMIQRTDENFKKIEEKEMDRKEEKLEGENENKKEVKICQM